MFKKIVILFILLILIMLFFFVFFAQSQEETQSGNLYIYFMEERVGYEEYTWQSDKMGYFLSVRGRMNKPIAMEIKKLTLRLDKSFIPSHYYFKGSVSGVDQEISSSIEEGSVENKILVAGQERRSTLRIRRDAFILPNPVFSPYMVLMKKFRCTLQEKMEFSAYIIPQLEASFTLEPKQDSPCSLIMKLSGVKIEIETDKEGTLIFLQIPSQKLKVIKNSP